MKYTIILFCALLSPSLYSMELTRLLKNKAPQCEDVVHDTKRALVRHLSHKLVLFKHALSMSLPQDIWREIYTKMVHVTFEGDKEFEEAFYAKPAAEAFQLYQSLKISVGYSKPIAPLYKMKQERRDAILSVLKPWYGDYLDPVISVSDQQTIHEFDDDVQQYFVDKEVRVISADNKGRYGCACMIFGTWNLAAYGMGALISSVSCCTGGIKLACSPLVLGLSLGMPAGFTLLTSLGLCWYIIPVHRDRSNKVTL